MAVRKILRRAATIEKSGLKKSAIYQKMAEGTFPLGINLTDFAVGWFEDEIDDWLASRPRVSLTEVEPKPARPRGRPRKVDLSPAGA